MKKLFFFSAAVALATSISFAQIPNLPGSGNALSFNGTSDYVAVGDVLDNVFTPVNAQFTISLWICPASMTNHFFVSKLGDSVFPEDQRQFSFGIISGRPYFVYYGDLNCCNSYRDMSGSTIITATGKWYNIVVTYDGSINTNDGLDRVQFYVNGMKESTVLLSSLGSLPVNIPNGTAQLGIGATVNTAGNMSYYNFDGSIDEVRIWNKALTQTEIRDNLCQKLTGSEAGLVGYWRFDETSGTTANDSQTNVPPNNGTLK